MRKRMRTRTARYFSLKYLSRIILSHFQSSESEEEPSKPLFRPVFVPKYVSKHMSGLVHLFTVPTDEVEQRSLSVMQSLKKPKK